MNSVAFVVDTSHHGLGPILYDWHPSGEAIASTGSSRVVQIASVSGELLGQVVPPSPSACVVLKWSARGDLLAIVQASSHTVVLWDFETHATRHVTCKLPSIRCLAWSRLPGASLLALVSAKGALEVVNTGTGARTEAVAPPAARRIRSCSWSPRGTLVLTSEARQIVLCDSDGAAKEVVTLRENPLDVLCCDNPPPPDADLFAVPQEGSSLSIVTVRDLSCDSAVVELALHASLGGIRAVAWKDAGSLVVGFESGEVSIVDAESARELRRTRRHDGLSAMDFCPLTGSLATCDRSTIKVMQVDEWANDTVVAMGTTSKAPTIRWSPKGNMLALGTEAGRLIALGEKHRAETHRTETWLEVLEGLSAASIPVGGALASVAVALALWAYVAWLVMGVATKL